jgi:hypothetical protein
MNDFISLQKDVALVSVLGPAEALRRADVLQDRSSTSPRSSSPPCCSVRLDPAHAHGGLPAREGAAGDDGTAVR